MICRPLSGTKALTPERELCMLKACFIWSRLGSCGCSALAWLSNAFLGAAV